MKFGHAGERSPEKDCWLIQHPELNSSSESDDGWRLKRI